MRRGVRHMTPTRINMAGQQIGAIRVLHYAGSRQGHAVWRCRCDLCGERFDARGDNLRKAQRLAWWRLHGCGEG